MLLNIDCMKDVLDYLVNNLTISYNDSPPTIEFKPIYLSSICVDMHNYSNEDIFYAIYNLANEGYISICMKLDYTIAQDFYVWDVTYAGQRFYQDIHAPKVWKRLKA